LERERCPSEIGGPPAASETAGSGRAVWRVVVDLGEAAGTNGSGWIDISGREWNDASWSDRPRHSSPCTGRIGSSRFGRYEKSHIDPVWRRDRRGGAIGSGRCVPMIPATTCRRICTPECATGRRRQNVGILQRRAIAVDTADPPSTGGNGTARAGRTDRASAVFAPAVVDRAGSGRCGVEIGGAAGRSHSRRARQCRECRLTTVASPSSSCSRRYGQEAAETRSGVRGDAPVTQK
jgi:hypothetical protein